MHAGANLCPFITSRYEVPEPSPLPCRYRKLANNTPLHIVFLLVFFFFSVTGSQFASCIAVVEKYWLRIGCKNTAIGNTF